MLEAALSKKAEDEFSRLSKNDQKKVFKKLKSLQEEPLLGKMLVGKLAGLRSLRAWPYRIIYEFQKPGRVIVYKILHSQEVYK